MVESGVLMLCDMLELGELRIKGQYRFCMVIKNFGDKIPISWGEL